MYLNKSSGIEDINVPSKADLNVLAFVQWSNKPTGIDEIRVFLNIPERLDVYKRQIVGGVGGVIVFLPNILILYFCISLMEDSGYMARADVYKRQAFGSATGASLALLAASSLGCC